MTGPSKTAGPLGLIPPPPPYATDCDKRVLVLFALRFVHFCISKLEYVITDDFVVMQILHLPFLNEEQKADSFSAILLCVSDLHV